MRSSTTSVTYRRRLSRLARLLCGALVVERLASCRFPSDLHRRQLVALNEQLEREEGEGTYCTTSCLRGALPTNLRAQPVEKQTVALVTWQKNNGARAYRFATSGLASGLPGAGPVSGG